MWQSSHSIPLHCWLFVVWIHISKSLAVRAFVCARFSKYDPQKMSQVSIVCRGTVQWSLLRRSAVWAPDRPDDGGSKRLWNVGKFLPGYTAQHPGRKLSSYSPPWEPEISHLHVFLKTCLNLHERIWTNLYVLILVFLRDVSTEAYMLYALIVRQ
jgi:hypothetical protein